MPLHSFSRDTLTRFCRFPLTFNLQLLASVTNFHLCFGVGVVFQGIERLESVSHVPGQSVTYVPGSSHAEELFFKRERLKFRGKINFLLEVQFWKARMERIAPFPR
jgi:hypothetical protein